MANTMPKRELDLITKAKAAQAYATTNLAAMGLAAGDLMSFTSRVAAADTAMNAYQTAKTNTIAARAAKDTGLTDLEKDWRALRRKLNGNANLTSAQREAMGLPVTGQTADRAMAVPLGFTQPLVKVDNSNRLNHVVSFSEASTPSSRARPKGVSGAEVWMAVLPKEAAAPRDTTAMRLAKTSRYSPYRVTFTAEDSGKIAWYMVRWVDTADNPGGWSEPTSAMIVS